MNEKWCSFPEQNVQIFEITVNSLNK